MDLDNLALLEPALFDARVGHIDLLVVANLGIEQVKPVVLILVAKVEVIFLPYECGWVAGAVAKRRVIQRLGKA